MKDIRKYQNNVKQKVSARPSIKIMINLKVLESETHGTREPGTREIRAFPDPQKIDNAQNSKLGGVGKVGNPSF